MNEFQCITSHTGTEGQLLQDAQLHRGLGNHDFIAWWSQPTFNHFHKGCPAPWCCPWPQHGSCNFCFTTPLWPWPTLPVQRAKPAQSTSSFYSTEGFFASVVPSNSIIQDQHNRCSGNVQPGEPDQQQLPIIRIKNMIKSHPQLSNANMSCREKQWMPGKKQRAVRGRNTQSWMTVRINCCHKIWLMVWNVCQNLVL